MKTYLTDEERKKIIEEETLRAEVRNKNNVIANEINWFANTFRIIFVALMIGYVVLLLSEK